MPATNGKTESEGWGSSGGSGTWAPLDLSDDSSGLPDRGEHEGAIREFKLLDKDGTVLRAIVEFILDGSGAVPAPLWLTLARRNSGDAANGKSTPIRDHNVVEGLRLLTTLAWATRTILPRPLPPYDLPKMFIGKRLVLTIDHQKKGGITGLIVRACGPV